MGFPVEPIEYGNDCEATFPPGMTPLTIFASAGGITRCPIGGCPPQDQFPSFEIVTCTQIPDDPCKWYGESEFCEFLVQLSPAPFNSWLRIRHFNGRFLFMGLNDSGAGGWFGNTFVCNNGGICGEGGFGVVVWNPNLLDIIWGYNLTKQDNSKFDFWPLEDEAMVVRFANIQTPMNIAVKLDLS